MAELTDSSTNKAGFWAFLRRRAMFFFIILSVLFSFGLGVLYGIKSEQIRIVAMQDSAVELAADSFFYGCLVSMEPECRGVQKDDYRCRHKARLCHYEADGYYHSIEEMFEDIQPEHSFPAKGNDDSFPPLEGKYSL